jgi:pimeloyl-ACP methyl ester carboxylesterase
MPPVLKKLKQLAYGARVLLSRSGELEMIDVVDRKIQMRHAGEGAPFFYLHSAVGETIWLPFLEKWAKQFEVFAPAHPGFAKSEGFDQISDIEDMAFHYLDLFDTLGLEKVNLGGVSLGGWIAVEFACRWPERVSHLWLANAPGLWVEGHPHFDLFRHAENVDALRKALFHDPNSYQATMILKDRAQINEETLLTIFQSMTVLARLVWERPYDPKLARRLRRVTCPTLVLAGESDHLVPPAIAQEYHKLIPGSRLHIFKECGHLPMFEKEAEFVDVIAKFCAEK